MSILLLAYDNDNDNNNVNKYKITSCQLPAPALDVEISDLARRSNVQLHIDV